MNYYNIEEETSCGVYAKRALTITHGKGAILYDELGQAYIDCVGGQGSANIGHAHPRIQASMQKQALKMINCPEMFHTPIRAKFQDALLKKAGLSMGSVFLCNSGTESVEAAFKFAKIITGKTEIVAAKRGFHGRTMGALSATWNKKYRAPFEPLVPGVKHISYNKVEDLKAAVSEKTAAVILELVQGEGGVYPIDPKFLKAARTICDAAGALLIVDEVQTGVGRTGAFLASHHFETSPDMICMAKSIAGGMPMGAVLINEKLGKLPKAVHGSTFGGNPLACALGLETINIVEAEGLCQNTVELGVYFIDALKQIDSPLIREVRGMGLMVGVELKTKVAPVIREMQALGVLVLPAGMTVVRFLPPLVIKKIQIDKVVEVFKQVLYDSEK